MFCLRFRLPLHSADALLHRANVLFPISRRRLFAAACELGCERQEPFHVLAVASERCALSFGMLGARAFEPEVGIEPLDHLTQQRQKNCLIQDLIEIPMIRVPIVVRGEVR